MNRMHHHLIMLNGFVVQQRRNGFIRNTAKNLFFDSYFSEFRTIRLSSTYIHRQLCLSHCYQHHQCFNIRIQLFSSSPLSSQVLSSLFNLINLNFKRKCHNNTNNTARSTATSQNPTNEMYQLIKTCSENHFFEPNISWNETINKARIICHYDINLYHKMIYDHKLKKYINFQQLESKKSFQHFTNYFFLTYNYQITGLVTILFTKLFLYSKHFLPKSFYNDNYVLINEVENRKLESDLVKLAEEYDMVNYGFYFHDIISHLDVDSYEKSFRNLLVLLGDYFLAKSSYDVASFNRIDLFKIYVMAVNMFTQGESLSMENGINTATNFNGNLEMQNDLYLNNDQYQSCYVSYPDFSLTGIFAPFCNV